MFDDEGLHGLPNELLKQAEEKYKVVDWMDIKSGMTWSTMEDISV